jgi:hypothetical protein
MPVLRSQNPPGPSIAMFFRKLADGGIYGTAFKKNGFE